MRKERIEQLRNESFRRYDESTFGIAHCEDENWEGAMRQGLMQGFVDGGIWSDCHPSFELIDKVCEWLRDNWRQYVWTDGDGIVHFGHWEKDLKKYMEEKEK